MELYLLLYRLIRAFENAGVEYLVTVSIASMAYGEQRFTNDVDVVAGLKKQNVHGIIASFPPEEFYVSEGAALEAVSSGGRFNIIHTSSGAKIDVIIKKDSEYDNGRFRRAKRMQAAADFEANFSSPEDVIIMKMKYYKEGESEKHLRDITGVMKVSGDSIDRNYIEGWAREFELEEIWNAILARLEG
ncbi:MAG: hypothetical protein AB1742_10910 [bacterium]